MKTFTDRVKSLITGKSDTKALHSLGLDFIKTPKGILKELVISMQSGNAIGVYSRTMGEGMFLTTVEHVSPSEKVVVFSRYDMSGLILTRCEIDLDDIQMVCSMNLRYRHPLLVETNTLRPYNGALA